MSVELRYGSLRMHWDVSIKPTQSFRLVSNGYGSLGECVGCTECWYLVFHGVSVGGECAARVVVVWSVLIFVWLVLVISGFLSDVLASTCAFCGAM